MKNIMVIFLAFICISVFGQNKKYIFKSTDWIYNYKCSEADTLGNGDSIWYQEVHLPHHGDGLKYKIYMDVDSVDGTSSVANRYNIFLQARNSEDETYTNLDTVIYQGTADTTFSFTQTSTAQLYKWFRIYVLGDADDLDIEFQKLNYGFYK